MATENKYDRQLRLWGAAGQKRLAEARILVLGAGPVASESLKNILLPGCCASYLGGFATLVDDRRVEAADVGNNFFVTAGAIGEVLAESVAENLRELNDECDLRVVVRAPSTAAADEALVLTHTLVIVATPLRRDAAVSLDKFCRAHRIPCIFARAYGLVGEVRASYAEHLVLNSRSLAVRPPLYVLNPFEDLKAYVAGVDLHKLEWGVLSKMPWLTVGVKTAQVLRAEAGGKAPKHAEVVARAQKIFERAADRHNEAAFAAHQAHQAEGQRAAGGAAVSGDKHNNKPFSPETFASDNFIQLREASMWFGPYFLPDEVKRVFDDPRSNGLDTCPEELKGTAWATLGDAQQLLIADEHKLWMGFTALKQFFKHHGCLPVNGEIPDMESSTELFNAVKQLYANKATSDRAALTTLLEDLHAKVTALEGIATDAAQRLVFTSAEILDLCKNSSFVSLLKTTTVDDELSADKFRETGSWQRDALSDWLASYAEALDDPAFECSDPQAPALWYLLLRAADTFFDAHGHYPGYTDETLQADERAMRAEVDAVLAKFGLPPQVLSPAHVQEICRFGAAELHAEAAFVGGAVAQCVTILVSKQFKPLEGVLLRNGINGATRMLEMVD